MNENIEQSTRQAQEQITRTAQEQAQNIAQYLGQQAEQQVSTFQQGAQAATQQAVDAISQAAQQAVEKITAAADKSGLHIHSEAETVISSLRKAVEDANAAKDAANEEVRKADQAKAEAEAAKAKAEEERDNAEKAAAFLKMSGDAEIERTTNETNFRIREKRILDELKVEREMMEVEADRKADAIQSGLQKYYPEFKENLEKIAAQEDEQ